jgi:hypothetical protein
MKIERNLMMSTYDGAYQNRKNSSVLIIEEKIKEHYRVIKGRLIDSYHYHGSWFEYTWELTLENSKGEIKERKLDTWDDYDSLSAATIEFDGKIFKTI